MRRLCGVTLDGRVDIMKTEIVRNALMLRRLHVRVEKALVFTHAPHNDLE